mmetsp:Transcript_31313/g.71491  ORF Transcript_31313/g.71491 Transcript_31313/m.71491 type:complete len:139 (-) Transcript_31313:185-601(-)
MALAPAEDGASCSQVRGPDEQAVKTAEQEEEEAEEDEHDDDGDDSSDSDDGIPMTRMNANGHLGNKRYVEDPNGRIAEVTAYIRDTWMEAEEVPELDPELDDDDASTAVATEAEQPATPGPKSEHSLHSSLQSPSTLG